MLESRVTTFGIADPDRFAKVIDKDFSISNFAGARGLHNGLDHFLALRRGDHHFQLHFGDKIDLVFAAAVHLDVTFLPAVSTDFADGDAIDVDGLQRFLYFF